MKVSTRFLKGVIIIITIGILLNFVRIYSNLIYHPDIIASPINGLVTILFLPIYFVGLKKLKEEKKKNPK